MTARRDQNLPPPPGSSAPSLEVTSSTDKRVYSPEEVARMLGLHPNTVYARLQSWQLPGIKVGRRWLVPTARLEAWLNGDTAG